MISTAIPNSIALEKHPHPEPVEEMQGIEHHRDRISNLSLHAMVVLPNLRGVVRGSLPC